MLLVMKDGTEVKCTSLYYQKSAQKTNESGIIYNVKFESEDKPLDVIKQIDTIFAVENISEVKAVIGDGDPLEFNFSELVDYSLNVSSGRANLDIQLKLA